MRKILVPFALSGLLALPVTACDVEDPLGTDDADTSNPNDTNPGDTSNPDTNPPPTEYYALIVDDTQRFDGRCATSSVGAHGADIDAVGLFDGDSLLGYFDTVDVLTGTTCNVAAKYQADDEVKGAPDGSLTENFVSLGGGKVIGEFTGQIQIMSGYTAVVYEIGDDFCPAGVACVGDEPYDVYVATDLDCVNQSASSCSIKVTGGDGAEGEATIPLSGF